METKKANHQANIVRVNDVFPHNIADPAHLVAYGVPSIGSCEGGRVVRFLIWLLTRAIKRELRTVYIHTNDPVTERKINVYADD